jgi:5-methylcytosine-specific restriction endonuclease McrA
MKICLVCEENKPFIEFGVSGGSIDGRQLRCIQCKIARSEEEYQHILSGYYIWKRNRRRAIKHGVPYSPWSNELGEYILSLYNQPCNYCGSTESIQIDHIISISKGGPDTPDNWQSLCANCNFEKEGMGYIVGSGQFYSPS